MPDDLPERKRKGSSKNRNAVKIGKKNYYERVLNELPSNQSKLFNLSLRLFGLNNHECANHNLSESKSCDLDPLPTVLLKLCLPELSAALLSIINHSLDTGVIPSHFKKARATPVPKSRATSYDDVSTYRPISQLPFISKVLERVVTNRIRPHLEDYHLFDKYQSAYRAAHSTEAALLRVHHDITSSLDKGSTVALVMLDQSAAFDVIDHDILLQRLEFAFGISGRALKWFGSYLEDRSQCVCVGKDVSKTLPVLCGVAEYPKAQYWVRSYILCTPNQ